MARKLRSAAAIRAVFRRLVGSTKLIARIVKAPAHVVIRMRRYYRLSQIEFFPDPPLLDESLFSPQDLARILDSVPLEVAQKAMQLAKDGDAIASGRTLAIVDTIGRLLASFIIVQTAAESLIKSKNEIEAAVIEGEDIISDLLESILSFDLNRITTFIDSLGSAVPGFLRSANALLDISVVAGLEAVKNIEEIIQENQDAGNRIADVITEARRTASTIVKGITNGS